MDAQQWDERYREKRQWSTQANKWVEQELSGAVPGRALDVACGEGRHAIWLAEMGWEVVGIDFSAVALGRAKEAQAEAERTAGALPIQWIVGDVTDESMVSEDFDLVLVSYVHLEAHERTPLLRAAARALRPGGVLLVIGHDRTNLEQGHGGPQEPQVLFSAEDVTSDLQDLIGSGLLTAERADRVAREVETPEGPAVAWDALVRLRRPAPGEGMSFA